jgi:hypothetical protein
MIRAQPPASASARVNFRVSAVVETRMPGPHAVLLLVVTVAAFYLYTRPWIRIELVSLMLLVTLLLIFYVFPFNGEVERLTEVEIFESFGRRSSTPLRISPIVRTLMNALVLGRPRSQRCTRSSGSVLATSDRTLVSMR